MDVTRADSASELRIVVEELRALGSHLQQLEYSVIRLMRAQGVTWEAIGEAHEPPLSRQRAAERYSHPKPRRQSKS